MIKITFPDGSVREYAKGITGYEIAESISQRLAQEVLVCSVNDEITYLFVNLILITQTVFPHSEYVMLFSISIYFP